MTAPAHHGQVHVQGQGLLEECLPTLQTRVSGHVWKPLKKPIPPGRGLKQSFHQRMQKKQHQDAAKKRELELRQEKQQEKQAKDAEKRRRRELKEEKERLEKLQAVVCVFLSFLF